MNKDERSAASMGADSGPHGPNKKAPESALSLPIQRLGSAMEGLPEWLRAQAKRSEFVPHRQSNAMLRWASEVEALRQRPGAQAASEPDKDSRWSIDRAADFLEQYAAFIEREKSDDIEQHPYLPELQYVAGQLRRWFAPAGERPAQAEPLMRMVPLSLLVRAREHAPYMGETWKALNEAMTTLGAQALDDAGTCHGCGVGRERLRLYLRGSVPQVMKTCDHCHIELFGEQECDANLEAMTDHCGAQAPSTAAPCPDCKGTGADDPSDPESIPCGMCSGTGLAAPSMGGAETAEPRCRRCGMPLAGPCDCSTLVDPSTGPAASPASKEDGSHE